MCIVYSWDLALSPSSGGRGYSGHPIPPFLHPSPGMTNTLYTIPCRKHCAQSLSDLLGVLQGYADIDILKTSSAEEENILGNVALSPPAEEENILASVALPYVVTLGHPNIWTLRMGLCSM